MSVEDVGVVAGGEPAVEAMVEGQWPKLAEDNV